MKTNKKKLLIFLFLILSVLLSVLVLYALIGNKRECSNHTFGNIDKNTIKWRMKNDYIHQKIGKCKRCGKYITIEEGGHIFFNKNIKPSVNGHKISGQCSICKRFISYKGICDKKRMGIVKYVSDTLNINIINMEIVWA